MIYTNLSFVVKSHSLYCKMVMDKAQVDYFDNDPTAFIAFILRNNTLTEEQKQAVKNLFWF